MDEVYKKGSRLRFYKIVLKPCPWEGSEARLVLVVEWPKICWYSMCLISDAPNLGVLRMVWDGRETIIECWHVRSMQQNTRGCVAVTCILQMIIQSLGILPLYEMVEIQVTHWQNAWTIGNSIHLMRAKLVKTCHHGMRCRDAIITCWHMCYANEMSENVWQDVVHEW